MDYYNVVGFEVLTVVIMSSTVFWVVMLCSSERAQRFGEIYCLNFSVNK
jgi:hypothetical protein